MRMDEKERNKTNEFRAEKAEKVSYEIYINPRWCKSCRICSSFCPKGVFDVAGNGSPVIVNPEACTGCKLCELRCPDFAISVRRNGGVGHED